MADCKVQVVDPHSVYSGGEAGPYPFDLFACKGLAQGDSWFSIGSIPPGLTSNTLNEMWLSKSTAIVNCAHPSKTLAHFAERVSEPMFLRLLTGRLAIEWDVLLFSGGGNDVIDAATVGPAAPRDRRLLLRPEERSASPAAGDGFVSEEGWARFADHLATVFGILMARRAAGLNRATPTFFHNYAPLMPRPSPAGFGSGPWLQPALAAYAVPVSEWLAVSEAFMRRLDALLRRLVSDHLAAAPGDRVTVIDTRAAGLVLAEPTATGASGDWQNEIHPTRGGYKKLAAAWRQAIDPVL
jgi:hypothetical protein